MRIAIINQPLGNRGDEAAHKAFVHALLKHFEYIDIVFLNREQQAIESIKVNNINYINVSGFSRGYFKVIKYSLLIHCIRLSFLHPLLGKFKKILLSYDLIICAPGGICMGGFMNWKHIWQLAVAEKLHIPVFYWGRSIGPFTEEDFQHRSFKEFSYRLFRNFSYISLRDEVSMKIARQIGVSPDMVVDSAFLETPNTQIPTELQLEIGDNYIIFVPNQLTWHYKYNSIPQNRIDGFHLHIIDCIAKIYPDTNIVMLPQLYSSPLSDYNYFLSLKRQSPHKQVRVINDHYNSDIQQAIIRNSKIVIGERYHSIVFAINNEVPFISLSYEHKMVGLLQTLGMDGSLVEIQKIFNSDSSNEMIYVLNKICNLLKNISGKPSAHNAKKIVNQGFNNMVASIEALMKNESIND